MRDYQLGFISNENIFNHVKETVELYRNHINLKEFNKNIIDPIFLIYNINQHFTIGSCQIRIFVDAFKNSISLAFPRLSND